MDNQPENLCTCLSAMKPLGARWITSAYDYLRRKFSGFMKAGIIAIENETSEAEDVTSEDPFVDSD